MCSLTVQWRTTEVRWCSWCIRLHTHRCEEGNHSSSLTWIARRAIIRPGRLDRDVDSDGARSGLPARWPTRAAHTVSQTTLNRQDEHGSSQLEEGEINCEQVDR